MGFPFALVCDLLEKSYEERGSREQKDKAVKEWFAFHRDGIHSPACNIAALLSTLLPEKRPDRVYSIQAPRLEKIIRQALGLGPSRFAELRAYRQPEVGHDLADRVEHILQATPNPVQAEEMQITVEEIDGVLNGIASQVRWSSPSIRATNSANAFYRVSNLERLYRRSSPIEAKWLTRVVLKDFQPLIFEPYRIYHSCDMMLPLAMKILEDFTVAIQSLQQAKLEFFSRYSKAPDSFRRILATLKPRLSVKVGRQQWFKARSIKHCLDLCRGWVSVETKMDGEYCQIHVDVSKGRQGIQIFSKSGKDSTVDRQALLGFIVASLKLGTPDCRIQKECILEGELVVYSDHEQKILPFHHIRNHVTRRGRFLHTEQYSRPRPYEHLMIIYYDMLLIDGESLLNARQSQRFKHLERVIHTAKGQAQLVPRQVIDTAHPFAASALRKAFAEVIVQKGEGLVLKPDLPYFNFGGNDSPFAGRCVKLKKEYIGQFGDIGDFAVVGAGFNPSRAKSFSIQNLKWTHFFLGCLDNREEVKRWDAKPKFTVVNEVELNATLLSAFVSHGDTMAVPESENEAIIFDLPEGVPKATSMTTVFTRPPVFDVRCFGFENAGNTGFWGLRFPMVTKVHFDRDYTDTISFEELQTMADEATSAPPMEDSQENLEWIAKLESADPRGRAVDAMTQETTTTTEPSQPSPSPHKSSQPQVKHSPLMSADSQHRGQDWNHRGRKHSLSSEPGAAPSLPQKRRQTLDERDNPRSQPTKGKGTTSLELTNIDTDSSSSSLPAMSSMLPLRVRSLPNSQPQPKDQMQNQSRGESLPGTSQPPGASPEAEQSPDRKPHNPETCRLAGSKCQLANAIILTDPQLQSQSEDLAILLHDHGLTNIHDPQEWAKNIQSRSMLSQDWQHGRSMILLVESVKDGEGTKELLCWMRTIRKELPEETKNGIRVYDWRVLYHVSIFEDEAVTKKNYDGFSSPWKRWFIGLV